MRPIRYISGQFANTNNRRIIEFASFLFLKIRTVYSSMYKKILKKPTKARISKSLRIAGKVEKKRTTLDLAPPLIISKFLRKHQKKKSPKT